MSKDHNDFELIGTSITIPRDPDLIMRMIQAKLEFMDAFNEKPAGYLLGPNLYVVFRELCRERCIVAGDPINCKGAEFMLEDLPVRPKRSPGLELELPVRSVERFLIGIAKDL